MKLNKRRRSGHKTDYHRRIVLLKGDLPRLVIRKTNKYIIAQIVESTNAQDKVLCAANSKDLLKKGWPEKNKGSLKSISAAYVLGLLLGKKATQIKKKVIVDSGLIPHTIGSKIYAVVKGVSDTGISVLHDEKIIPNEKRIMGEDSKIDSETFNKIKGDILKS